MVREISAGGVVVRQAGESWEMAVIEPQTENSARPARKTSKKAVLALPKGLVDPGEKPEETALREVAEETGAHGRLVEKLGDVRYVYTWSGERIFKVVSFYLLRYSRGRLGELPPETAHEVAEVRWLPVEEGPKLLAYGGERDMAARALASLHDGAL